MWASIKKFFNNCDIGLHEFEIYCKIPLWKESRFHTTITGGKTKTHRTMVDGYVLYHCKKCGDRTFEKEGHYSHQAVENMLLRWKRKEADTEYILKALSE